MRAQNRRQQREAARAATIDAATVVMTAGLGILTLLTTVIALVN